MECYKAKSAKLAGTSYQEVRKKAFDIYLRIKKQTKRKPYVRSAYFKKEKIFLDLFWHHLFEKPNWKDRVRRLKYFPPAIELIRKTRFDPRCEKNRNKQGEVLYRFAGITGEGELFYVQIKEITRSGQKFLISIFPE